MTDSNCAHVGLIAGVAISAALATSCSIIGGGTTSLEAGGDRTATFIEPMIEAGSVGELTGDATYSLPLEMPSGTGGMSLPVVLRYSSGTVNAQSHHMAADGQSVGLGWTMDLGSIRGGNEGKLSITMNGLSGRLFAKGGSKQDWPEADVAIKGSAPGTWDTRGSAQIADYETKDASFDRIRRYSRNWKNDHGCYCSGNDPHSGCYGTSGGWVQAWIEGDGYWEVTKKDGTRYYFGKANGWDQNSAGVGYHAPWQTSWAWNEWAVAPRSRTYFVNQTGYGAAQKKVKFESWQLDRVVDPHGNRIEVEYQARGSRKVQAYMDCPDLNKYAWKETYPRAIRYTYNTQGQGDSHAEWRVEFDLQKKDHDNMADYQLAQSGVLLNGVKVIYKKDGNSPDIVVREYRMDYTLRSTSSGKKAYTLDAVRQYGKGGAAGGTLLGSNTFEYTDELEVRGPRVAEQTRRFLKTARNMYGAATQFWYQPHEWSFDCFKRRVRQEVYQLQKRAGLCPKGSGTYCAPHQTFAYSYSEPKYHKDDDGSCSDKSDDTNDLNGYRWVTVQGPAGKKTRTRFYADDGDPSVVPGASNERILLGKPRLVETYDGAALKSRVTTSYSIESYPDVPVDGGGNELSKFVHPRETVTEEWGDDGSSYQRKKTFEYGKNDQNAHNSFNGAMARQWGMLTRTFEFPNANEPWARMQITQYAVNEAKHIIVPVKKGVVDSDWKWQSEQRMIYCSDTASVSGCVPNERALIKATRKKVADNQWSDARTSYDGFGNVTKVTAYTGYGTDGALASDGARTTTTTYDTVHHAYPETQTNAKGHQTYTSYYHVNDPYDDARGLPGQVKAVTNADGSKVAHQYDAFGRPLNEWRGTRDSLAFGDASKAQVQMRYDDHKRLKRVRVRTDNRDDSQAGSFGDTWVFFDGWGRQVQLQKQWNAGAIQIVNTHYNNQGLVADTSVPITRVATGGDFHGSFADASLARERSEYDALGRMRSAIHPDGSKKTFAYHKWGHYGVGTGDERGNWVKRIQDGLGRTVEIVEKDSAGNPYATTRFAFDDKNALLATTDARGNVTSFTYDLAGRKLTMNDPDMGAWSYQYDALGQMTRQTDASGQVACLKYDVLGRLTRKDYGCNGSDEVGFEYDNPARPFSIGRQWKSWTSEGVSVETEFDRRGNPIYAHYAIPGADRTWGVARDFDQGGRVRKVAYPSGEVVTTSFDDAGNPRAVCTPEDTYVVGATYNERGSSEAVEYGNGVRTGYEYYGADGNFRLKSISTGDATDPSGDFNNHQREWLRYDAAGNVTQIEDWRGPGSYADKQFQNFSYDALGRLVQASATGGVAESRYSLGYQYDQLGRMTALTGDVAETYSYDGAHAHAKRSVSGQRRYWYDANGNMTQRISDGVIYGQDWTAENHLKRVEGGGHTTEFVYGPGNELVKKVVDGLSTYYIGGIYETDGSAGLANVTTAGGVDECSFESSLYTTVTVRAKGSICQGSYPTMRLVRDDGSLLQQWTVTGDWKSYSIVLDEIVDLSSSPLRVEFPNDCYVAGQEDRNLYVDYLQVGATRYQAEAPNTYSEGGWTVGSGCTAGYKRSEVLACAGYLRFSTETPAVGVPGTGDIETSTLYVAAGKLHQAIRRGGNAYTRSVPLTGGYPDWSNASKWYGPYPASSLPGSGIVESQTAFILPNNTLVQGYWRNGQGYSRSVPLTAGGSPDWGSAGAWNGPFGPSGLPGSGSMNSQSGFVLPNGNLQQGFWRGGQGWSRKVPLKSNGSPDWNCANVGTCPWGGPWSLDNLAGEGMIEAQAGLVLPNNRVMQTYWRGGQMWLRYARLKADGNPDWNAADAWQGPFEP